MTRVFRCLFLAAWLFSLASSAGFGAEVGESWPDFSLRTFDGAPISRADLEGQAVLLVFWNTWCPSCRRELPEINRHAQQLAGEGVVILAVNTGINDSERRARSYWQQQGFLFPSAYDRTFEVGQAFRILGVPTIYLIDSQGVVRYKQAGLPADLEGRVAELFVGQADSGTARSHADP